MNSRQRCVPQRRLLFATCYLAAAGLAATPGRVRNEGKNARDSKYLRTQSGREKGLPWSFAHCFSPVINNEDGMRMLPARGAGTAPGQAPGTSENAVSPRDLTDGDRAFSLRRRGGSLTFHRPHASSRGYLSRCARSAFASRTNTRPE
jgi:hypothetical protein